MKAKAWITAYAEQLGVEPPTADEFKAILDLAAEAAHGSGAHRRSSCLLAEREGGPLAGGVARARA